MKLSNRTLLNSIDALNKINNLKLPVRTSFKLAKLTRKMDTNLKDYHKILGELQDKHAQKDENGEKVVVDRVVQFENKEEFGVEFEELLECENDLAADQITLEDLGSVSIEPSLLYHLDWLIKE